MKTFDERRKSVHDHMQKIHKRRRRAVAAATSISLVVTILAVFLFIPYDTSLPDVSMYADSTYYPLIQRLNEMTFRKPAYKNRFQQVASQLRYAGLEMMPTKDNIVMDAPTNAAPMPNGRPVYGGLMGTEMGTESDASTAEPNDQYQEVTDNQVAGVVEADILKRSEQYAYYLRNSSLYVYAINGEDTQVVTVYAVNYATQEEKDAWGDFYYLAAMEMYLSQDCKNITILVRGFRQDFGAFTVLLNLDVSDPRNVQEINRVYFSGDYLSSRMVDGDLLLAYNHKIDRSKLDFEDPETFVPSYGTPENMTCIPGEQILCPETASSTRYTVLCKIDGKTLQVQGSAALMSYSQELYVSQDTIYATHSYSADIEIEAGLEWKQTTMTQITGVRYTEDNLQILGTIDLEGSLKDQYSMDQFEGILRVVASTSARTYKQNTFEGSSYVSSSGLVRNVNLYCVDLTTWEITGSVIAFAPAGEDAQSVRFDGYQAYVCTAEVITFSDPVYFFDLSDLHNITWTDTGTIDGYSTSLIQLGDGYLLGIGFGTSNNLKIEVYEEYKGTVISVASFERNATFSSVYKSYFVDRDKDLIGLHVADWDGGQAYILLHFDGYSLHVLSCTGVYGNLDDTRAFMADGYVYIFTSEENGFCVNKIV